MFTKYLILIILSLCVSIFVGVLFHKLLKQKETSGNAISKKGIIVLGVVFPLFFCLLGLIMTISVKEIGPLAANQFDYSNMRPKLVDSDNLLAYDLLNLFGFMPHAGDIHVFNKGIIFMIVLLSILLIACGLILNRFYKIIKEHGEKRLANYMFWGLCSVFVFACICFGHAWNLYGQLLGTGDEFSVWSILIPLIPAAIFAYQFYKIVDERLFSTSSSNEGIETKKE